MDRGDEGERKSEEGGQRSTGLHKAAQSRGVRDCHRPALTSHSSIVLHVIALHRNVVSGPTWKVATVHICWHRRSSQSPKQCRKKDKYAWRHLWLSRTAVGFHAVRGASRLTFATFRSTLFG